MAKCKVLGAFVDVSLTALVFRGHGRVKEGVLYLCLISIWVRTIFQISRDVIKRWKLLINLIMEPL